MKLDLIELPKLKRIDSSVGRCYETPSGNRYPSVTTVLSSIPNPELEAWRDSVGRVGADDIAAKAAARGTAVHNSCESYILTGTLPKFGFLDIDVKDCFYNLKPVIDSLEVIKAVEIQLYSDRLQIAGSADIIAIDSGELKIVDWKTASRVKTRDEIHSYFMQCAAYAYMFHERTNLLAKSMKICITSSLYGLQVFEEPVLPWILKFKEIRKTYTQTFN